ncbi:hypothetical protein EDD22DRAFT_850339 [Suillus occidentalis]|nr:hypothetical protein EDD22DRAFT_850339 [Suillus occidentalis]
MKTYNLTHQVLGCDGMRIWDLKKRVQLLTPPQTPAVQNPADPVTCACWITRHEATRETLCYGTGLGFIGIWQQQGEGLQDFDVKLSRRIGMGKEIMCLTYDHTGDDTRIASGTRDRRVQVWAFDFKGPLVPIFSVELATTIPRTVNFNRTASRNILVFGMYDGEIHTLRGTDGVVIATNNAGPLIGHASVDTAQTLFLMDNVMNGFSLHRLDDATYDGTHHSLIFGATSMNDTEPTISIWCRKQDSVTKSTNDRPLESALKNFVQGIAQLAIAMALIAYVLQVLGTRNTSRISLAPLGNAWQEYLKFWDRPQDLTNDVRLLVEKYIEDQKRNEGLKEAQSSVENGKHARRVRRVKPITLGSEKLRDEDMRAVILLGN